jgi:hypothetical protein
MREKERDRFASMKSLDILSMTIAIGLGLTGASAQAPSRAGTIPENGFWVVVTNEKTPDMATVQFYDLSKHLIYEEHLTGVRFDLSKRITRKRLNQSLQSALIAWDENKQMLEDKGFVAARFGGSAASTGKHR